MTDYDRGEFVRNRTILIEPCANGTFTVLRGRSADEIYPRLTESMGFSSAADLMRFLQSEFTAGGPEAPNENPQEGHDVNYDEIDVVMKRFPDSESVMATGDNGLVALWFRGEAARLSRALYLRDHPEERV